MKAFDYARAGDAGQAIAAARAGGQVRFVAGGTTLLDLMKLGVEQPDVVVDINRLPLAGIEPLPGGGLRVGALVRNSDLAHDPRVRRDYPVLSQALLAGASAQLRNRATTAGNLLQRTRCMYFRDIHSPCNKREPGSGCAAIGGRNRSLAVLGTSAHCIATNPSDMNVALAALEASVAIEGPAGYREVAMERFHLLPGDTPQRETVLEPGELVTHVLLPAPPAGARSHYLKLRDRASYEFALASAAVVMRLRQGRIDHARVALGGVATKPWRAFEAERLLEGEAPGPAPFAAAAAAALRGAEAQRENGFKIELARRCVAHALALASDPDDKEAP